MADMFHHYVKYLLMKYFEVPNMIVTRMATFIITKKYRLTGVSKSKEHGIGKRSDKNIELV